MLANVSNNLRTQSEAQFTLAAKMTDRRMEESGEANTFVICESVLKGV